MNFFLHIIVLLGAWLPMALGYNFVFGKGKILHFGPLGVSVCVGYIFALTLIITQSFLIAACSALIGASILSLFFAWLALRLEPDGLGVMSIALHLSMLAVVLNWQSVTRGALGIPNIPRLPFLNSVSDYAIVSVILCVVSVVIMLKIDRSSIGRELEALAENEWHAMSLGINRTRTYVFAFLILGVTTVLANALLIPYLTLLHPNDYLFPAFVFYVMIIVSGKPGSVWGVTLATILLVFLKEGLRLVPLAPSVLGPVRLILFGLILFIAVYVRRDTLFPKQRSI